MPCISSCPKCHRDLTIPDALEAASRLRCPLCDAEFSADQVLADAVDFPPEAIVVSASSGDVAVSGEAQPQETLAAATADERSHPNDRDEIAAQTEAEPDEEEMEREAAAPAGLKVRPRNRAKSSAFGVVGQLAGMAFGGVLGLAIGYYVLLWIGGPQADFLEVRSKLPGWMLPPERGADGDNPRNRRRRGVVQRNLGDLLEAEESDAAAAPQPALPEEKNAQAASVEAMPVNFEQSAESQRVAEAAVHEALAAEHIPDSMPDAPPSAAASPPQVGPRSFNVYSLDELEGALARAGAALGCEHCHATGYVLRELAGIRASARQAGPEPQREPCPRCGGKPMPGLTAEAFDRLCLLADAVTFAQLEPDDAARDRLRQQIQAALLQVAMDRGKTQIVGRLAGARLQDSQRLSNGIVLAGTIQELGQLGPLYRIKLVLFGAPKAIVVLSQQTPQPPLAVHDRVLILGSIIDSPIKNLAGYAGNLTQVVWGGLPLKLQAVEPETGGH